MVLGQGQIGSALGLAVALHPAAPASAHTLAESGKAAATIVVAAGATAAKQTAAREVAEYLRRMSGATFLAQPEGQTPANGSRIFVGPTAFARSQGLIAETLGPEEWIIRTLGNDLVILGGPPCQTVRIATLNLQGKPAIPHRDIFMLYGHDGGRLAARNRLHRAQALFDQPEQAVESDAILRRRVRHARLPLDRATLAVHSRLTADWLRLDKPAGQSPPDRPATARRAIP